jgi:hypothetical protein
MNSRLIVRVKGGHAILLQEPGKSPLVLLTARPQSEPGAKFRDSNERQDD